MKGLSLNKMIGGGEEVILKFVEVVDTSLKSTSKCIQGGRSSFILLFYLFKSSVKIGQRYNCSCSGWDKRIRGNGQWFTLIGDGGYQRRNYRRVGNIVGWCDRGRALGNCQYIGERRCIGR